MNPFRISLFLTAFALSLSGSAQAASNSASEGWPQWRGPDGTGAAPHAKPPLRWSETENVKWKVEIPGSGHATPIIWGDRVFVQTAIPTGTKVEAPAAAQAANPPPEEQARQQGRRGGGGRGFGRGEQPTEVHQFVLMALDRATGKVLWQKTAREEVPHEGHHRDHGYSSSSPVTDGKLVIAYFGSRGLHCYDMEGNLKWSHDLGRMNTKLGFGEGSSPALHGNVVVVNWDHEGDDFIVAFDKETGRELWRRDREEDTTWATPVIVVHDGKAQVITAGTKRIRSYDLNSGEPVWESEGLTQNVVPTPVSSNGMVYLMSGFRGNALFAIRLGKTGDLTGSDSIVWSAPKNTPYVPSPLLYGNRLSFFSGNQGIYSVLDARTGRPLVDAERVPGISGVYASPVGANDHVYLVGRDGTSVVIKNADALEVVATNKLDDEIDASPAIAGNQIFLRGKRYLYCLAE